MSTRTDVIYLAALYEEEEAAIELMEHNKEIYEASVLIYEDIMLRVDLAEIKIEGDNNNEKYDKGEF